MSTIEQETARSLTVTIGLDRTVTLDEYARILVAIGQISGVESVTGDPAVDITDTTSN